jgi:hypothetical protein
MRKNRMMYGKNREMKTNCETRGSNRFLHAFNLPLTGDYNEAISKVAAPHQQEHNKKAPEKFLVNKINSLQVSRNPKRVVALAHLDSTGPIKLQQDCNAPMILR